MVLNPVLLGFNVNRENSIIFYRTVFDDGFDFSINNEGNKIDSDLQYKVVIDGYKAKCNLVSLPKRFVQLRTSSKTETIW